MIIKRKSFENIIPFLFFSAGIIWMRKEVEEGSFFFTAPFASTHPRWCKLAIWKTAISPPLTPTCDPMRKEEKGKIRVLYIFCNGSEVRSNLSLQSSIIIYYICHFHGISFSRRINQLNSSAAIFFYVQKKNLVEYRDMNHKVTAWQISRNYLRQSIMLSRNFVKFILPS